MTVLFTDDFERADSGDISANWDPFFLANGGIAFQIVSGVAKPTDLSSADGGEVYSAITLPADHWAECTLNSAGTGGTGSGCGPCVRASAPSGAFSYYRLVGNGAGWELVEFNAGVFVGVLASGSGTTFTAGDTIYLQWVGSGWTGKKGTTNGQGGTSFTTGTDATLNANIRAGITYSTNDGANAGIRQFVMGDFAAQSFPPFRGNNYLRHAMRAGL